MKFDIITIRSVDDKTILCDRSKTADVNTRNEWHTIFARPIEWLVIQGQGVVHKIEILHTELGDGFIFYGYWHKVRKSGKLAIIPVSVKLYSHEHPVNIYRIDPYLFDMVMQPTETQNEFGVINCSVSDADRK